MKKIIWGVASLAILTACSGKKSTGETTMNDSDSLMVEKDSLFLSGEKEYKAVYSHADNLFDDFLYAFTTDKKFQRQRIMFPLTITENGKKGQLQAGQWNSSKYFPKTNTYVVLYDNKNHYKIEKDTSLTKAGLQWVYLKKKQAMTFDFRKVNRCWMLSDINISSFKAIPNGDFLNFYAKFSTDSLFQSKSIKEPLTFLTTETSTNTPIEGALAVEQWFAFKPFLPHPDIANVLYGQKAGGKLWKVMVIKGASNGSRCILTFRKTKHGWMLVKYEN